MGTQQSKRATSTISPVIRRRVADTRARVCEVAARKFNEESYAAVSIDAIVASAEIARSSFYRFFRDKDDLLRQIIDPVFDLAVQELAGIAVDQPESIVNGIADSYLQVWSQRRDGLVLSMKIGATLFPLVQQSHDRYVAAILVLMNHLHEARMLRHDDPRMAARLLALTTVPVLQVCERHPQFQNVFRSTLRGLLLKW
jgi:AcrR family transcriptional regulator